MVLYRKSATLLPSGRNSSKRYTKRRLTFQADAAAPLPRLFCWPLVTSPPAWSVLGSPLESIPTLKGRIHSSNLVLSICRRPGVLCSKFRLVQPARTDHRDSLLAFRSRSHRLGWPGRKHLKLCGACCCPASLRRSYFAPSEREYYVSMNDEEEGKDYPVYGRSLLHQDWILKSTAERNVRWFHSVLRSTVKIKRYWPRL